MGGRDKLFDLLGREIRAIDLLRHDGRAKDARLDVLRGLLAGAITNKQNAGARHVADLDLKIPLGFARRARRHFHAGHPADLRFISCSPKDMR